MDFVMSQKFDVAIIGAGLLGIASAFYLARSRPSCSVILIDAGDPLALTSAQSGNNYRNWWPQPVMVGFINRSTTLMERIALETDNRITLTRREYLLASRSADIAAQHSQLTAGIGATSGAAIRVHTTADSAGYQPPDHRNRPTRCTRGGFRAPGDCSTRANRRKLSPGTGRRWIKDQWQVKGQRLLKSFHAEIGIERDRQPSGQEAPGEPIQRGEVEEPARHGDAGDVQRPDPVGSDDGQLAQHIRVDLVPRCRFRGVWSTIERLESHPRHQGGNVQPPDLEAFVNQQALQHPAARDRELHVQPVDLGRISFRSASDTGRSMS